MRVNDTTEAFLKLYENKPNSDLKEYHQMFPDLFQTYFNGYCRKTDDRMDSATKSYQDDLSEIKKVRALLRNVIEKSTARCRAYFGFSIDVPVHIFVGLYASNAFVDHDSAIYLAVEKLHPDPNLLEVIITHEMIHSYHNHILNDAGIDWLAVDWDDVRHSIYREGIATYLSQKIAPGHQESIYYSYDYKGEEWLSFCKNHFAEIARALVTDIENQSIDMEREWLRLSGGKHFGYNRLGYFLGTRFVIDLCKEFPESAVLTLLAKDKVPTDFDRWVRRARK